MAGTENDSEIHVVDLNDSTQESPRNMVVSPKNWGKRKKEDPRIEEAFQIMKDVAGKKRDECDVFGEHVANKLRKYDNHTRVLVEHHINNILFDADIKMYSQTSPQCLQHPSINTNVGVNDVTVPNF